MKSDDNSGITLNTLYTLKEKNRDTFAFRKDFIKTLLSGNILEPLINFEQTDTEKFINPNSEKNSEYSEDDTRYILRKKTLNFFKIINQTRASLCYIKSGTTGHTFKSRIKLDNNEEFNYAVKVVAYPFKDKYGPYTDVKRPENAEIYMLQILSLFVLKKETPHIILPIGTFDTSIEPFVNLIETHAINQDNVKYKEFVEKYKKNEYYDKVSVLMCEWANRGDLLDFIRSHYKKFSLIHWKVIFFQIISTLAVIHTKYPSFRHNDLKANNILVHKLGNDAHKFTYCVHGQKYVVNNIGYQIKICDFDFACIPGLVENSKVSAEWTNNINVTPEQNRYYDIHFFFNTLIKKGFMPEILTDEIVPQEVKSFINRVVPDKYKKSQYIHKRGRLLKNIEYVTPLELLEKDIFFQEFSKKN